MKRNNKKLRVLAVVLLAGILIYSATTNSSKIFNGLGTKNKTTGDNKSITIEKKWENVEEADIPESIEVNIYRKTQIGEKNSEGVIVRDFEYSPREFVKTITITKADNWKKVITDLEFKDQINRDYLFEIEEVAVEGFETSIVDNTVKEKKKVEAKEETNVEPKEDKKQEVHELEIEDEE